MPNDAKLGLVLGIGLVIAVAVGLAQKDPGGTAPQAVAVQPAAPAAPVMAGSPSRPTPATPAARTSASPDTAPPIP
jgi:hypothetical protein